MRNLQLLVIIIIVSSCSLTKTSLLYPSFDQLTLDDVEEIERTSEDITPDHLISIGTGIYPNKNNYKLQTPKTYKLKENKGLTLETEYFLDSKNTVRVVLYQWDYSKNKSFLTNKERNKKFKIFKAKFDQLVASLTSKLGEPTDIELGSENNPENYRGGIQWLYGSKNAYLFVFGNDLGEYRQIRLAIYGD